MEGREEGREEAQASFVENLLKGSEFTVEKIASLAIEMQCAGLNKCPQ